MNVNTSYKALLEGRISKSEFLRQARQGLPQYITNVTSFDDAVKILRQKSILSEELVYQNKADKFPLESIQRGIRYELEEMDLFDINSPSKEEYMKARKAAIDNLCKDPLYYIKKVAEQTDQPEATEADHDGKMYKVDPPKKQNLKEGKYTPTPEKKEDKPVEEAAWTEFSNDPVYIQFFQHYLKKAKEAKDVNADKTARKMAKKAFLKYQEKHAMKEAKKAEQKKIEEMVLKESVIHLIGKILGEGKVIEEAATTNLAALSDENASISELPTAINSLENIVTEIESFWLKEQQKIQGVFDSLGNIKNEDGLPIGYKFAQPMMESLKKDLTPVLEKISLESVKLPEAPAPDQTQVNDPNAEVDPNDPNAIPPVPEKKTVFSPADKEQPLQENKKNRRYTK